MAKLSILGMACAAAAGDLAAFERAIYAGSTDSGAVPDAAGSLEDLVRELLAEVASADTTPLAVGVVVCADDRPQALVRQVADAVTAGGAVVPTAGYGADCLVQALALASEWLTDSVDLAVVLSAGDLGKAGLLVGDANRHGVGAYAVLEACDNGAALATEVAPAEMPASADLTVADVGYLEVTRWPPSSDVVAAYRTETADLTCAVSSMDGDARSGAVALALVKAALCVHRRMLVPTGSDSQVDDAALRDLPFYVVPAARPWFPEGGRRRVAHVACPTGAGIQHFLLSEPEVRRSLPALRPCLRERRAYLIPVVGDSLGDVRSGMAELGFRLEDAGTDLAKLTSEACRLAAGREDMAYALALVGHDREELSKELRHAEDGVGRAFETEKPWHTPKGSAFTAVPLGSHGVTFVYPGVFNSYIGLGQDLFQHFPDVHERLATHTSDPGALLAARLLYPRSQSAPSRDDLAAGMARLQDDPIAMIESGSAIAIAHHHIVEDVFDVHPSAAMGYSMGEGTMFWGSGVWQHAEEGSRALRASPVFSTMVSGPRTAVRDAWNLGPDEDVDWATYLLKAKLARVREAVAAESCVYVTFVNLTNEVVIAGDASGCRRVIEALDCHALPVPASVAIHNEAISSAHGALVDLYMHPVVEKPDVAFYSVANYGTLTLDERSLAEAMATMCCQPVDFPRLVSHVYDEGARIFLELGPLATCTRRIGRILRGRPHAAVAVNPSPGDDLDGFIRALAVLVAHRVPLDLAPLYERPVPDVVTIAPREQHAPLPAPVPEAVPEPAVLMSAVAAQAMGDSVAVPAGAAKPAVAGAVSEASVDRAPAAEGAGSAPTGKLMDLYADQLLPHRQGVARMHEAFLLTRSVAQERASSLISMQIAAGRQHLGHRQRNGEQAQRTEARQRLGRRKSRRPAALFDEAAVSAFASGDVTDCFGSDFEIYEGRRLSRIPNGDLLMMSRVLETEGEPHTVAPPAALSSEFDVPVDAWFYAGDVYAGLPPNIVLMEMALQPCGFLSAYLRSSFLDPDGDLYFRNLDGRGRVLADLDLRGKTVRNEVRLLSSTRGQGAIIQSFDFRMLCEGIPFYEGWSSFGFFPQASLERQVGIGAANETQGRQERAGGGEIVRITEVTPKHRVAPVQLTLVNEISVQAPQPGAVLLTATGRVTPEDWYFKAHFYQDPVMPGSLGVEAAYQAMVGYARARYPRFTDGVVRPDGAQELTWKYRGQITPRDSAWLVRVRMTDVDADQARARLVGSAEIWKGDTQIYQVDGLALQLCRE